MRRGAASGLRRSSAHVERSLPTSPALLCSSAFNTCPQRMHTASSMAGAALLAPQMTLSLARGVHVGRPAAASALPPQGAGVGNGQGNMGLGRQQPHASSSGNGSSVRAQAVQQFNPQSSVMARWGSSASGPLGMGVAGAPVVPPRRVRYSPLAYNIEDFCQKVVPTEEERQLKMQVVDM